PHPTHTSLPTRRSSELIDAAGNATRLPFANNQIPANRFNPVAKTLMDLFPAPNIHGSGDVRSGEQIHQSFSDRVKAVRRYLIVREGEPCGITGGVDELGRASCRERCVCWVW